MNKANLITNIKSKQSFLCVGLDTDIHLIPPHLLDYPDPIFEFNKAIIEATQDFCVAYKPNTAFYERPAQYASLHKTFSIIPATHFSIADAKRADIGNTSLHYASAFFDAKEGFGANAITLHPYMGNDSVKPFLEFHDRWVILLALTSNPGAEDFELQMLSQGDRLFERVMKKAMTWATADKLMFVVGATVGSHLKEAREIAPQYFFLVPGVGAQGGSLNEVFEYAATDEIGLLVNAGRSIIYADNSVHFAEAAREEAYRLQQEMARLMRHRGNP
ncbi:MAG: orotidine-5'-phosphate decarboxylase [Flavobacteriales bacterium]|jgi:orotidine-5'-phosphate decarboxylase|nr:orotidine-5'-phosphate decarboxylase [Flavobacteriales bacterium]